MNLSHQLRNVIWICAALLMGALAGAERCRAAEPVTPSNVTTNATTMILPETYLINVGDRLGFRVLEDREETRLLQVFPGGDIDVPYLGRVVVAGKSLTQATKEVKALLEKDLYYQATVVISVEEMARHAAVPGEVLRPKQVFVVGQVRMQGAQDIPPGEKYQLSRAIIKAGGFGSFANGRKVQVIRKLPDGKTDRLTVDVLAVLKEGKLENDIELKPEDMVIVPERLVNF